MGSMNKQRPRLQKVAEGFSQLISNPLSLVHLLAELFEKSVGLPI